MRKKSLILIIIVPALIVLAALLSLLNYIKSPADLTGYPYSIPKKSESELKEIEKEFKNMNSDNWRNWYITLNDYTGIPVGGYADIIVDKSSINSKEKAHKFILDFFQKNKELFYISEGLSIVDNPEKIATYSPDEKFFNFLIVPQQKYKSLPIISAYDFVTGTPAKEMTGAIEYKNSATVQVNTLKIMYFNRSFYPLLEAPTNSKINKKQAIEALYNKEIYLWLRQTNPASSSSDPSSTIKIPYYWKTISLSKKNLSFEAKRLVILSVSNKNKTRLEFRLCWEIEIRKKNTDYLPEHPDEHITNSYVDAITGKVIVIQADRT